MRIVQNSIIWMLLLLPTIKVMATDGPPKQPKPKLIIGITIDQMRFDYLDRFWGDFGKDGFKRLIGDGFQCTQMRYNYMPTYTGPGHASIFTGTTPCYHGIIQNDWFDRYTGQVVYCASDSSMKGVGTLSKAGQMSPQYLTASTLGDMLQFQYGDASKVIGVALKDRGAILPAGRTADAAYWFVGMDEGKWCTSTWYGDVLPAWVNDFNASGAASQFMEQTWNLARSESDYSESMEDNNPHETPFKGTLRPVFPYVLRDLAHENGNYELLKATPFGNDLTVAFAEAAIRGEQLGADEVPDMLCLSFSSTDYVGHQFGIHSREIQDCYIRLDSLMGQFLKFLDDEIGKGEYVLFISADHGGAPTPSYTMKNQASAGYWKSDALEAYVEDSLAKKYGAGNWVLNESNQNIFLNRALITSRQLSLKELQYEVSEMTLHFPEVLMSFTSSDLSQFRGGNETKEMIQNGFSQRMSGDVIYVLKPGYLEYGMTGTTHGSPFNYDRHVPAIFYGAGVQRGSYVRPCDITDIAATMSAMFRIPMPDACTGHPIIPVFQKRK
jgi:predicted AlkP superfamily pyrophosphatase or phosphodiesterase